MIEALNAARGPLKQVVIFNVVLAHPRRLKWIWTVVSLFNKPRNPLETLKNICQPKYVKKKILFR